MSSCPYSKSDIPELLQHVQYCFINKDSEGCEPTGELNKALVECNTQVQSVIDELNKSVMDLNVENEMLKHELITSYNKNNVSGQLFMSYKEIYSIYYFRNVFMMIGIVVILISIGHAFSKTTEGEEVKSLISQKFSGKLL